MADRDPGTGDVLGGRYELLGELGRGGMATVFRGRDLRLQRTVAVKVFRGGFAEAMDPRRIAQEMQLLAGFDHPSVVSVLDASTGDGVFGAHLVMEFVHGSDLGAMLHAARGPLAADFARRVVADVADALQALHDKGVVHRDVKPANILVPRHGAVATSRVTAKLTDFGIAQMVDDGRSAPLAESILGTAAYLSPEQVRGIRPRPASDVYSLGLVLLEALTGRRAFPGPAAESATARLQRRPTLPDDASPALADLLSRMTALDPAQRPQAGEVAELLRTQLAGRVTRPDATHTAPTPISGVAAVVAAPVLPTDPALTAPHTAWPGVPTGPVRTGSVRTGPMRTGPMRTGAVRTGAIGAGAASVGAPRTGAVPARKRFPTALAVAASVLAAGVAAVAISAAAGVGPARTDDTSATLDRPGSTAPSAAVGAVQAISPSPVAPSIRPSRTPSVTPTPTPTASRATKTPTPTPTPTASTPVTGPGLAQPVAPPPSVAPSASAEPSSSSAPPQPQPQPVDPAPSTSTSSGAVAPEQLVTALDG